jgi:hypothetical protein
LGGFDGSTELAEVKLNQRQRMDARDGFDGSTELAEVKLNQRRASGQGSRVWHTSGG